MGELSGLPEVPAQLALLDSRPFRSPQLDAILKRKKSTSKPGPNQIPYKLYTKCPRLKRYLFGILKDILRSKAVIPKVTTPASNEVGDYRQIALLNVEGKLFWSLISERLYHYLGTNNRFVSPYVQKGSMKKVAGCWEHTSMVWSALKDARATKGSLAVLWLDLANAYGSVPHKLIVFALK